MNEIQKFILDHVSDHPSDVTKLAISKFGVSRTAIFFHIKKLIEAGKIIQEGSRNKTKYYLATQAPAREIEKENTFQYQVGVRGEDDIWKKDIKPVLGQMLTNVEDILRYSFTEMFNNVIDHSESKQARVEIFDQKEKIEIQIFDSGIGIFKKIADFFEMKDLREAVIKLHQGKVTTDESRHTGQGIFFTSRAVDVFTILANGFRYIKDNATIDDWYWERQSHSDRGTIISLEISKKSNRLLKDVFDRYTNSENFHFEKSHIRIELGNYEEESFVSRSQAKRLLVGLSDFKTIILDFKNIRNVGQAFVDEVFGVFGFENPEVKFEVENANDDILFMIKRGLADREFPLSRVELAPL